MAWNFFEDLNSHPQRLFCVALPGFPYRTFVFGRTSHWWHSSTTIPPHFFEMMKSFKGFASRSAWTHHPDTLSLSRWRGGFWVGVLAATCHQLDQLESGSTSCGSTFFNASSSPSLLKLVKPSFSPLGGGAWKLTTPAVEKISGGGRNFQRKVHLKSLKSTESATEITEINRYLVAFDAFGTTSGKTISFLLPFLGFFFISPGSTGSANFLSFRFDFFLELAASSCWLVTILTLGFFTFFTSIGSSRSSIGSSNLFTFFGFVLDFLISVFSSAFSDAFFWTESAWHVFQVQRWYDAKYAQKHGSFRHRNPQNPQLLFNLTCFAASPMLPFSSLEYYRHSNHHFSGHCSGKH